MNKNPTIGMFVGDAEIERRARTGDICVQCESNARWNEAGGYNDLAEECREYCRRGHVSLSPNPSEE